MYLTTGMHDHQNPLEAHTSISERTGEPMIWLKIGHLGSVAFTVDEARTACTLLRREIEQASR
jgi:hypothetical protein